MFDKVAASSEAATGKEKTMKKIFSVLLTLLILLGLCVGCGQTPEPDFSKDVDVSTDISQEESSTVSDDSTDDSTTTTETDASGTVEDSDVTDSPSSDASDNRSTSKTSEKTSDKGTTSSPLRGTTSSTTRGQAGPIRTTTKTTVATSTGSMTKTTVNVDTQKTLFDEIPAALSKQKVKMLVWWPIMDSDNEQSAFFTEKTGIGVKYETINASNYQTRLSAMIMSNNAPSCAAMLAGWYPQPITRGLLQPIKNTGWDFTDDIYATNLMDEFAYKGEYYAIALTGSVNPTFNIMFFNRDLLKRFGVTQDPYQLWKAGKWNWDTCLEMARKCTDISKGMYGMTLTWQYYWMVSAGQDFVVPTKDGLMNNVKNPAIADAWMYAWRLTNEYKVVDHSFTDSAPFYAHTSALYATGSYEMQNNQPTYPPAMMADVDWGVVPFPSPAGMDPIASCDGTVWGFPSRVTGDELQAAAWFLRYWLDDAQFKSADFYPKEECWEVMNWMWEQKIESFNSMGVLGYGGEYDAANMQPLIMEGGIANIKNNLDSWYGIAESNIKKIETEMPIPD